MNVVEKKRIQAKLLVGIKERQDEISVYEDRIRKLEDQIEQLTISFNELEDEDE